MASKVKLSIIIPCYNAEPYINELLKNLQPQINEKVQVLVIDDGSKESFKTDYSWATVIRQENGGASKARNTGLDNAKGEYVSFIDADDLVANNYVETILDKIKTEKFDYCYLSWKTMPGGWQQDVRLNSIDDKFPPFNLCVWNRVYRRDMIGDVRFNVKKKIAEDAEFIRAVKEEGKKKAFIGEYMYFYRSGTPNSLTKRFSNGEVATKRVVYYYPHVTADMTNLIDEFRETDKEAEIILMTDQNDIPELAEYAMILQPTAMKGTELRGMPTTLFHKVNPPLEAQVVIYTRETFNIGGIETWIYNFCVQMHKYYDILVLYDLMDMSQINRLRKYVQVERNVGTIKVDCDTVIVNRITDSVPKNVNYKQKIQMVHACRMVKEWKVPQDNDYVIPVSNVVYESFKDDINGKYEIINNMTAPSDVEGALLLVSATRLSTFEKGQDRMVSLAKQLSARGVPFIWLYFADRQLKENIPGMFKMEPTLDVGQYVKQADYLVQLSDAEGFCYSIVEALELGTPVITTPVDVLDEIGVKDGENAYIVPFDMGGIDIEKIYYNRLKGFKYKYDNESRVKQWRNVLGDTTPTGNYSSEGMTSVRVIREYQDLELKRIVKQGEVIYVKKDRANQIVEAGFGKLE